MSNQPIMEVKDLSVHFKLNRKNTVHAVTHVNLTINHGETVGLVGESGWARPLWVVRLSTFMSPPPVRLSTMAKASRR